MITEHALKPNDYLDPAVLATERKHIFRNHWHLVGLVRDLPHTDDWCLVPIAGTEVILQNVGNDDIRGFTNTCPHRFSAIRTETKGNGALRCPYHMWAFDSDGMPSAVPLRGDVVLDACRSEERRLDRWSVERCGELLFVAHAPKQSLAEFLGPLLEPLAIISNGLGEELDNTEQDIAANWKIILQNTIEFDHSFSVHPETFAPMVERPLKLVELDAPRPHIAYIASMRQADTTKPALRRIDDIFARCILPPHDGYAHWTLFPSSTLGTTRNRQFALIFYQPTAINHTRAKIRIFATRIAALSPADRVILDKVMAGDLAFTRRLLDEDKRICETVHRGLTNAPAELGGCLMPGERLVGKWQEYWREAMGQRVK
jgi:phenylpropionate dioxygenase-like ring-hydroxylating dioxygenase large terminal subunit